MRHTSEADCGVCNIDPEVLRLGIPSLLVYTPTGGALGDFVHALIMDFCRENCSGGVFAGTQVVASVHSFFRVSRRTLFIQLQQDKGQPNYRTDTTIT